MRARVSQCFLVNYFLNFVLNYFEKISASALVQDKVQDVVRTSGQSVGSKNC